MGGHSTGTTLAILVAAARSDLFQAVFAFGPVADVGTYGPLRHLSGCERALRSPVWFVSSIKTPTYIIEGERGNSAALYELSQHIGTAPVHTYLIPEGNHFNVLEPISLYLATRIAHHRGTNLELSQKWLYNACLRMNFGREF